MSLEAKWEAYGRPATEALNGAIGSAKGDEPLAPVTVVVPSNYVGVATRRLLGSGSFGSLCNRGIGLAAVSFVTVYRMAELLGSSRLAGSGRRPVSTPVIAAAFRAALAEEPGIFAPVADHAATESALVAAYRELRDLSPASLDSLARTSARAADVVRLHHMVRSRLEPEWYDEEDLIDAATEVLSTDESLMAAIGTVVVYLPERLSLHGARLLRAVAERSDVVALAGTTGDPHADAEVATSIRRLNDAENCSSGPTGPLVRGRRRPDAHRHCLRLRRGSPRSRASRRRRHTCRHATGPDRHPAREPRAIRPIGARAALRGRHTFQRSRGHAAHGTRGGPHPAADVGASRR